MAIADLKRRIDKAKKELREQVAELPVPFRSLADPIWNVGDDALMLLESAADELAALEKRIEVLEDG